MISKALEVWGLTCASVKSEECRASAAQPERETAFICNLRVCPSPSPPYSFHDLRRRVECLLSTFLPYWYPESVAASLCNLPAFQHIPSRQLEGLPLP